ncbi:MAG: bifunctional transaldolase/phosoglucose isomerase [Methylobacteriaceae bacterium]|nr:bifunctional transaldolase/phosoglucose isomerase [Methylobacteriaceae bacterium]
MTAQPATPLTPASHENPLVGLHRFGQSVWLDDIRRKAVREGELAGLIAEDGLRGVTSNPAIFEKAIGHGDDYDEAIGRLLATEDLTPIALFEHLAIEDIQGACDLLRPVYDASGRRDGFASLEVSPFLALRTDETVEEARRLWARVGRENLMIKVPGTEARAPAIRQLISEGINVNVTLLFSRAAYAAVAEAHLAGLEGLVAAGGDPSAVAGVASFFISRIDTSINAAIDKRIEAGDAAAAELKALRGRVAIANAKLAYRHYQELIASERWRRLAAKGAQPQRLLWASTGAKDKTVSDVLYVEELVGPDTVNTMPPATLEAFRDHGRLRPSLTEDLPEAERVLAETARLGLDLDGVTDKLLTAGIEAFEEAADKLMGAVAAKRATFLGARLNRQHLALPKPLADALAEESKAWRAAGKVRRLWTGDATVWTGADEARWLGWLTSPEKGRDELACWTALRDEARAGGFAHALLLGMGGSSLGPEVLAETYGPQAGFPVLHVLDSTDPAQIRAVESRLDLARTLFIVSSKSGSTLEPNILKQYFFARAVEALGPAEAPKRFIAVTDPGSKLEAAAAADGFRHVVLGDSAIGGRYSVLSPFGLVPGAIMGLDLATLLESALRMLRSCDASAPPSDNPGVALGLALGLAARDGRDKLTILASPGIAAFGAWLEQLVGESTGKGGRGIIPLDGEPLAAPESYGTDRVFAYLRLDGAGADDAQDRAVAALEAAGHPVVRIAVTTPSELAQEFVRWEIATAVAGAVLALNPFDQPDVEASKIATRALTDAYEKTGELAPEVPFRQADGVTLFADPANAAALSGAGDGLVPVLRAHLARLKPGDYAAILAYLARDPAHDAPLQAMRRAIRDAKRVATCLGYGPRFLHSTGQAYKGGPNSGVFLQITAEDAADLPVPGQRYTFGVVKAAQARGDLDVLNARGRRALRVHLGPDVGAGLAALERAVVAALEAA